MKPSKLEAVTKMAADNWDKYIKATDPQRRRLYARSYEFWAAIRDEEQQKETETCEQ